VQLSFEVFLIVIHFGRRKIKISEDSRLLMCNVCILLAAERGGVDIILAFENGGYFGECCNGVFTALGRGVRGRLVPRGMAQGSPAALLELWNGGGPGCGCLGGGAKTWGGRRGQLQAYTFFPLSVRWMSGVCGSAAFRPLRPY
jgi:hypothetical protein